MNILTEEQKRYLRIVYLENDGLIGIPIHTIDLIEEQYLMGTYTDSLGRWLNERRETDTKGTPYESIWITFDLDGWDTINGEVVTYNTKEIRNEIMELRERYGVGTHPLPHGYFIRETPNGRMKICKSKKK